VQLLHKNAEEENSTHKPQHQVQRVQRSQLKSKWVAGGLGNNFVWNDSITVLLAPGGGYAGGAVICRKPGN